MGFITTFSSYGGLLWNATEVGDEKSSENFGIFPLYSLVLAVSALKTPAQLREYLEFRVNSLSHGVKNFDELEYVFGFLSKKDNIINGVKDSEAILFRQYELDDHGVWIDPRVYSHHPNWKDKFLLDLRNYTRPVTPPVK